MSDDQRRRKRFRREHREKTAERAATGKVQIVYRPKTDAEARRRVARSDSLVGTPFVRLTRVCSKCGGKGFVNPDGSSNNAFEGADSDATIKCAPCRGAGKVSPPDNEILFTTSDGYPATAADVEMIFNDALLMDAISNWGEDGPLSEDTFDARHLELYRFAQSAYAGVELPAALVRPDPEVKPN